MKTTVIAKFRHFTQFTKFVPLSGYEVHLQKLVSLTYPSSSCVVDLGGGFFYRYAPKENCPHIFFHKYSI